MSQITSAQIGVITLIVKPGIQYHDKDRRFPAEAGWPEHSIAFLVYKSKLPPPNPMYCGEASYTTYERRAQVSVMLTPPPPTPPRSYGPHHGHWDMQDYFDDRAADEDWIEEDPEPFSLL